jgi:outer membrane immunogenic protein
MKLVLFSLAAAVLAATPARFATSGRVGIHITPSDKLYATAGYNYGTGPNGADVGGGLEHSFAGPLYGKVEYKHYFNEDSQRDSNAVLFGAGVHF